MYTTLTIQRINADCKNFTLLFHKMERTCRHRYVRQITGELHSIKYYCTVPTETKEQGKI